jgi:hypothetical protein
LKKKIIGLATLLGFLMVLSVPSALAVVVDNPPQARGPPVHVNDAVGPGTILVTSDGTTWYTIVPYAGGSLPRVGNNDVSFQNLDTGAGTTPYGPGDVGYRGGRWYTGSTYFLCPLTRNAPGT